MSAQMRLNVLTCEQVTLPDQKDFYLNEWLYRAFILIHIWPQAFMVSNLIYSY